MADDWYLIKSDNFVCAICLDEWINSDPRSLPCQHTFCFECLENLPLNSSRLTCPLCSRNVFIENGEISRLPKNIFKSNIRKTDKKIDSPCEKHNQSCIFYCIDHNENNLCINCLENDHSNCQFHSMDKEIEYEKKLKSSLEQERLLEEELMKILLKKKKEMIEKVEDEIQYFSNQIHHVYQKRKNYLKKLVNKEIRLRRNDKGKLILFDKPPQFTYDEMIIKSGLGLHREKIRENFHGTEFEIGDSNDNQTISPIKCIELKNTINNSNLNSIVDFYKEDSFSFLWNLKEDPSQKLISVTFRKFEIQTIEILSSFTSTLENLNFEFMKLDDKNLSAISNLLFQCHRLKSINFSWNANIGYTKHPIFENLENSSKTLENIDLSFCNLAIGQNFYCTNLLLTCRNLKSINFGWNRLIDGSIFGNLLFSSNTLESLNFCNCDLDKRMIKNLSDLFSQCSRIKNINLSFNKNVGSTKNRIFQNLQKSSSTLETINLCNCDLEKKSIKDISDLFLNCSNLKNINLSRNKNIGCTKYPIFQNLQKSSSTLETLELNNCQYNDKTLGDLSDLFSKCLILKNLNFGWCKNIDYEISSDFKYLQKLSASLGRLYFNNMLSSAKRLGIFLDCYLHISCSNSNNLVKEKKICCKIFQTFENLRKPQISLQNLDFQSCNLNVESLENISNLFLNCTNLKSVKLSFNSNVGTTKFPIFQSLYKSSSTLENLDLQDCNLNEENIGEISNLLFKCSNIKFIDLSGNRNIGFTKHKIFKNLYKSCNFLETLDLQNCNLSAEISGIFFDYLLHFSKLKTINLAWNKRIGDGIFPNYRIPFKSSIPLENLDLRNCDLNEESLEIISDLFLYLLNLKSIDLSLNEKVGHTEYPVFKNLQKSSSMLETIHLQGCDLNEENIKNISDLFSKCSNLKFIDLSQNKNVGSTKSSILKNLRKSLATLKILALHNCFLNEENLKDLNFIKSKLINESSLTPDPHFKPLFNDFLSNEWDSILGL